MSMPELGSKISLISKADIRYEGKLFTVDPQECTIALSHGNLHTHFYKLIFSRYSTLNPPGCSFSLLFFLKLRHFIFVEPKTNIYVILIMFTILNFENIFG